jgi:DNA polymerase V
MDLIKAYKPEEKSFSSGQVLHCAYDAKKARTVVMEMAEAAALSLVEKGLVTDQMVLTVGYDIDCLTDPLIRRKYKGEVTTDFYGRKVPKPAHGTANLGRQTSSGVFISKAVAELYDRIVNPDLLVRRMYLGVNHVVPEKEAKARKETYEQLDLFTDYAARDAERKKEDEALEKEKSLQKAMLDIRKKYGSNSIVKGVNMKEESTGRFRNETIGGHRA